MRITLLVSYIVLCITDPTAGDVSIYGDKVQWQSDVGEFTTIDFTGFPNNTLITSQYAALGIVFTDQADFIYHNNNIFLNDGIGLRGGVPQTITMQFATPIQWIAMEFPGLLWAELYLDGQLFYASDYVGNAGAGNFAGLVSTIPFNKVRLFNQIGGGASVDDLYFGPPIPAPGAIVVLGAAVVCNLRRRRAT